MHLLTLPGPDRDHHAAPCGQEGTGDMAGWLTDWNGHAVLIDGVWRYAMWRDRRYPVRSRSDPGDHRGGWRYDAPDHDPDRLADLGCADAGRPIPGAVDLLDDHGQVAGLLAPEAALSRLVPVKVVTAHFGWRGGTMSTNLSRGYFPRSVVTIGDCQAWTWPLVDDYERWRPALG